MNTYGTDENEVVKGVSLSHNLRSLLTSTVLMNIGSNLVTTFGVIFFYEQFNNSLTAVLFLYGLLYLVFALTAHFGALLIGGVGMKRMMVVAIFFLTGATVVRALWETNPTLYLLLFFIFFVLFKMLFWVPYHVELTAFTNKHKRGRQMAFIGNISELFTAVLPFLSGLVVVYFGFEVLFYFSAVFTLVSAVPLILIHDTHEVYEWKFLQLLREFFKRKNRSIVISNFGNGVEDAVGTIIWPVFIFILLLGDYVSVGLLSSVVMLSIIMLTYFFGRITDFFGNSITLRLSSLLNVSGWLLKLLVESATSIYFIDTYHKLGKTLNMIPFKATVYDVAEYNKHYVDEYIVLRETAFLVGKSCMCFLAIVLLMVSTVKITFIIAALATLTMTLVSKKVLID
ncbi:MAG: Major facilitator superfamily [Parcubacteria group bacterium GW2011_GWA2_43_11]|nr:MAG: Major facilitator superfamily [Parcubacteria group bacterium GW2011_GWC2_42_11]KKS84519.1 MAG: Major facilitator superfamily [Parcubacteria group bacterium GW2011_GWA2_43_11]